MILFLLLGGSLFAQQASKDSLLQIGMEYLERSDLVIEKSIDSCIIYTELAAEYFKQADSWLNHVIAVGGVGGAYYYKGDFEKSKTYYDKALKIAKEKLGEEPYHILIGYAVVYYKARGENDEAIDLLFRALENLEKSGGNPAIRAVILQNIGNNYREKGDYEQAIAYLTQALTIQKKKGNQNNASLKNAIDLASCYRQNGAIGKAIALLLENEEALRRLPNSTLLNNRRIETFTQLADIYLQKSQTDSANIFVQKALALQETDNSLEKNFSYRILGQLSLKNSDMGKALTAFEECLRLSQIGHTNFPYHSDIAEAHQYLAETYDLLQQSDKALVHFQKALLALCPSQPELGETGTPPAELFVAPNTALQVLRSKAAFLSKLAKRDSKYYEPALTTYHSAIATIREIRKTYSSTRAKQLLAGTATPVFEGAIQLCWDRFQQTQNREFLNQMYVFAEGNKANLMLESLQESNAQGKGLLPDSILRKEQKLNTELAYYQRKIQEAAFSQNSNAEILQLWKSTRLDLQQKYEALQREIAQAYPAYYELKYDYALADYEKLRASLPDDQTALLHYFIGDQASFLFVVSKQQLGVHQLKLSADLRREVIALRNIISTYPNSQSFDSDCTAFARYSSSLYKQLLEALSAYEGLNQLIIVPDRQLHYLPFEVLLRNIPATTPSGFSLADFDYLLEQYMISYAYSGTLWLQARQSPEHKATKNWIGFAPSFGGPQALAERGCQLNELYGLQCNAEEVENIKAMVGGESFLDKAANKEQFQQSAGKYRIIHLATHACVDLQSGDHNRIFFTDDYISSADLNLLNLKAELAVLSACNTGTGELLKGEGVLSLARSFTLAGVPSTLTSLWSVDDCTTSSIMQGFYTHLLSGTSKAAAIRQAKLDHLNSAEKVFQHPYFWAAFVQYGNPEAIRFRNGWPLWSYGAIAFALVMAFWGVRRGLIENNRMLE